MHLLTGAFGSSSAADRWGTPAATEACLDWMWPPPKGMVDLETIVGGPSANRP
jgi:hypothetical protein